MKSEKDILLEKMNKALQKRLCKSNSNKNAT